MSFGASTFALDYAMLYMSVTGQRVTGDGYSRNIDN